MRNKKVGMPSPPYLWAEGLLDDDEWINAYIGAVLSWPKSCSLTVKERHLIGLGKAIAYLWEPGVLIHIDQALKSDATLREVNDAVRVAAVTAGLADLDNLLRQLDVDVCPIYSDSPLNLELGNIRLPAKMTALLNFDQQWFQDFLTTVGVVFRKTSLDKRTQYLICLAVSAVKRWTYGVKVFSELAAEVGATRSEVVQVIASVFKTAVSTSMQVGFRYPCYTPDMNRYRLICDSYRRSRGETGAKQLDQKSML